MFGFKTWSQRLLEGLQWFHAVLSSGLWLDSETCDVTVTHVVQTDLKCRWFSSTEVVSERLTVRSGLHWLWIWRRTSERSVVREPDQFQTEKWADETSLRLWGRSSESLNVSGSLQGRVCDSRACLKSELLIWTFSELLSRFPPNVFSDLELWRTREEIKHQWFLVNWLREVAEVAEVTEVTEVTCSNTLLEMFCDDVTFCFHTPVTLFVLF